mgnify:CR=1 FL=1
MLGLYKFLIKILFPFFFIFILIRRFSLKEHKVRYKEKLMSSYFNPIKKSNFLIWFHAASVGEVMSVFPIIDKMKDEKPEDIMATLSWLTVKSNLMALKFVPKVPLNCILVGGGQKNKYLVNLIKDNFPMNVFTAEELKIPGDYIEAELIAFLSARRLNNLYSTFPSTTGVSQNIIIGKLIKYK